MKRKTRVPRAFRQMMWRGRVSFRRGEPMAPRPADDEDRTLKAAFWYGYMLERAKVLSKQFKARRILEDNHDPDDRPPAAMPRAA